MRTIHNFSQLKLSADLAIVEHPVGHTSPGQINARGSEHTVLRHKTQIF